MCVSVCVSPPSPSAVTSELVRLTTENSHLREDKQRLETASEKISSKAGTLVHYNVHRKQLEQYADTNSFTIDSCRMRMVYVHLQN